MKQTKYQIALKFINSSPIFFKNGLIKFLRFLNFKTEKYYADLHYQGPFLVKAGSAAHFKLLGAGGVLENRIFWYGIKKGYEPEALLPWLFFSKKYNAIVDIGANVGIYTLASKAVNPAATVIAFEPSDTIYNKLSANISVNNYKGVVVNKVGVSDNTGVLKFYDVDLPDHTSASFSPDKSKSFDPNIKIIEHQVEVIKLDDYITQNAITKIDLIKIDVELFEKEVLTGALNCIKNHRPVLFFEVLTDEVGANIQQLLAPHNYTLYHLGIEHGKPKVAQVEKLFLHPDDLWNFLAIPTENKSVVEELTAYLKSI